MSDIERSTRPACEDVETAGEDGRADSPGGDISSRSDGGSIEGVEEETPAGGMEGEGDPGA